MTQLTAFQDQLIQSLQSEFARLNPQPVANRRFTVDAVKNDIQSEQAFRESVIRYNSGIAKQLEQDFYQQITTFNNEFAPLDITWGNWGDSDRAYKMFHDDHSMKNPHSAEIGLFFNGDSSNGGVKLYVLYDFKPIEIETTSNRIIMYKITGICWTTSSWLNRKDSGAAMYKTFDEFIQNEKSFQQSITSKFKHLTK